MKQKILITVILVALITSCASVKRCTPSTPSRVQRGAYIFKGEIHTMKIKMEKKNTNYPKNFKR